MSNRTFWNLTPSCLLCSSVRFAPLLLTLQPSSPLFQLLECVFLAVLGLEALVCAFPLPGTPHSD